MWLLDIIKVIILGIVEEIGRLYGFCNLNPKYIVPKRLEEKVRKIFE